MFELKHLTIRSKDRLLVADLSLTLPPRGVTALIGPSGCGKSSVLKWLAGIAVPGLTTQGELQLDGKAADRPSAALSYQPQSDALFPWLTIAENVALGLEVAGWGKPAARAKVAPLFKPFGLSGCEQMYPAELSGGMRQRAAFLRTVAIGSRVLLLDEPFSALDAVTRLSMQDWLRARLVERACSVLLVTHDLAEATALADRVLVMAARPGRIIAEVPIPLPADQRSEVALAPLRETLKSLLLQEEIR
jgi:ABC-type nitrate/sulfonate/bicarbonate transport system ATPase subunit